MGDKLEFDGPFSASAQWRTDSKELISRLRMILVRKALCMFMLSKLIILFTRCCYADKASDDAFSSLLSWGSSDFRQ
jgi:hypothetical protein